jgi:thioredoxin 1
VRDSNQNKNTYGRCQFVSAERFELSTNGLKGRCSAVELRAQHKADCILTWDISIVNVRPSYAGTSIRVEVPMAEMLNVTEDTFKVEVLDASQPVLVDFSAVWCQPCKMLDPIVKQLAGEWDGQVKVVKIDADENPNLVMQFGVMGIPTLLFFKGGEIKERITGFLPKDKLVARFSPHFN